MKPLLATAILFTALLSNGQSTDITNFFMSDWQKAEILYEKWAYKNAIELYERVLEKNPNEIRAKIRIAECYKEINELAKAINWYRQIIDLDDLDPIHYYNYAQALSIVEDYEEARIWYEVYGEARPNDRRSHMKVRFIDNMDIYVKDPSLCHVGNLEINSGNSDFGAVPHGKGFIFLSARDNNLFIKYKDSYESALDEEEPAEARLDFYFTSYQDTSYAIPKKLHDINTRFHEGPLDFFHNSSKVIFTRNNFYDRKKKTSSDGRIKLKVFVSEIDENGNWVNFIPFPYNDDEYSVGHPALSLDDKILYFSSDMPGGFGGSDLYYSAMQNGQWGEPINLGAEVNTPGDEMFPFYSHDGKLYFASDGHGGFGGLDIYRGYPKGTTFGSIENLGTPINSSKDDFAFSLNEDGRTGYISSNRVGGKGRDDIYEFNIRYRVIVGRVHEIVSRKPVPNADVAITDLTTNKTHYLQSNQEGILHLDLPIDSKYSLVAEKEGYSPEDNTSVSATGNQFETDTVDIYMWKHQLFAEGRVFSNETHELLPNAIISISDLTEDTRNDQVVGADGSYFFILRPGRKYLIEAEVKDHISTSFNLNTEGMTADTLRNDFVLEETYIDKNTVFFDFDKHNLSTESLGPLNQMVNVLKKHTDTYIVISAHADAQGTPEYNKELSDRRAKSVVTYLQSRGINNNRIQWYGFGEELLLNQCSDGVECHEEDHSKNRRAELKIENFKETTNDQSDI